MVSESSGCSDLTVGSGDEVQAEVRAVLKGHSGGLLELRMDEQRSISW